MEASLTCAVCLSLLEEPVTLPLCSHNFCRGCVLECMASAEAARLQQLQRSPGQARLGRGAPGPGPGPSCARVPCPLCRKLCLLPRGGVAALPVNTTLAEVVKLYRSGAAGAATAGEAALGPKPGPDLLSLQAFGGSCQKHPSRTVQLYCRMCRQAGCGQCVSEEHQGIFHSVNLIDTVYQEEKLTFFSTLKQMRIINEKLVNEISKRPNDADMMLKNDVEIIELKFGEIFKTLEAKKQQLLEDQRGKKEKEFQIWKKMKETHKKTIENFLKDCEKLVHECDPQCFLEVACGLNTRMKTQLDVMNIASSWEKPPVYVPKKIDIKSVVNEILALELTPVDAGMAQELPYEGNESSTLFKDTLKQWQDQKNIPNTFLPVAGQDETDGRRIPTRFMSISEMSAFQNMSHEELRYKYYMELQKLPNVFKTQNFPANKKYKFVTAEASKDESSGISFISSPTKANKTDKIKMGTLQKGDGFDKRNCSGSSAHSVPSTSRIFSETNGDFKLFHEGNGQEVSGPALAETSPDSLIKEKWARQASAEQKKWIRRR
ncbi:tripartite motif-containing protein 54-like isoform X2 [Passer montanus]|uniref:tripartite motif-containing protein 54-like isoform X2 n=1 Tax=Passer montanus TaxID=9160 RepID=UPI0019610153|nr:tripartite motif-containing protein 54-like isoform X2 [Passer montanus]